MPFHSSVALGDAIETGPTGNNLHDLKDFAGLLRGQASSDGQPDGGCPHMVSKVFELYAASLFTCTPAHFSNSVSVAA